MNYLARFDDSMVVGHLKSAHSTDADVLHGRQKSLVANMELCRKLAILPMLPAAIWVLIGIPALLILIGIFPILAGSAVIYACVWCRRRMAANIIVAQAAYANYISSLTTHATVGASVEVDPHGESQMNRLATLVAVCLLAASCGGSSPSPTAPTRTAPLTPSAGFGTLTPGSAVPGPADFPACLASAAVACFSSTHLHATAVGPVPNSPTNLVAAAVGGTVTLTWTAGVSGSPVEFIIEAGSTPGAADLASLPTASTFFSASGVGAGMYYVRVRARSIVSGATSGPSNEAILVVGNAPCVAPGAPTNLAVISNSGGGIGLSWLASSGAPTSYLVEAGSSPGLSNLANSDLGLTTTLRATGVGAGTYYVRVRAKGACGISGPSNEVQFVVGSAPQPTPTPGPTQGLAGTWSGTTSQGLQVILVVSSANTVTREYVAMVAPGLSGCPSAAKGFALSPALSALPIISSTFTTASAVPAWSGGSVSGTFTSSSTASGTAIAHLSRSFCPQGTPDVSVTWTATKQ